MRCRRIHWLAIISIVIASLASVLVESAAAQTQERPQTEVSREHLEDLLRTIEDPAAREQFAERIRTLIAAAQGADGADATSVEELGIGFVELLGELINAVGYGMVELSTMIVDLPLLTDWLARQALEASARAYWFEVIGKIALLILLCGLAYRLTRHLISGPLQKTDAAKPVHLTERIWLLAQQTGLRILPIIAFAGVGYATLPFLDARAATQTIAKSLVDASIVCLTLILASRILLAPTTPELRLFRLPDDLARSGYRWLRRFIYVVAYSYVIFQNQLLLQIPGSIYGAIERLLGFVVAVMVIVLVLQNRERVAAWLQGTGGKQRGQVHAALTTTRHLIAEIWPLFAVFYVISTYLIWALDIPGGFELLLRGALVTTFLLAIARPLAYGVRRILDHRLSLGREVRRQYPAFERRLNRYVALFRRIVVSLIYVVIGLALVHVWGIDLFGWIRSLFSDDFWDKARKVSLLAMITLVIWEVVTTLIENYLEAVDGSGTKRERSGRARTVLPLFRTFLLAFIAIVVTLTALATLGINVTPLLAAAGVVGIAVGFGSQKLVQDVIGGLFILFQDTIAVGDFVEVAGHAGVVERISLRTINLRDLVGVAHTVPLSEVTTIKNFTKGYSCADLTITVAYKEDIDQVMEVIGQVGAELQASQEYGPHILQAIEVLGLDEFADSAVVFKARVRTKKMKHLFIKRAFNRLIKLRFDELGIEIPFPHQTVYFGHDKAGQSAPARLQLEPQLQLIPSEHIGARTHKSKST